MITQTFDLNLIPEQAPVVVHCDQYDKGTGRLIVKLYEGDTAYTPVGSAVIQGCKPDGRGFQYNASLSGNTVTANLTEQMSAVAGHVRCQIVVTETTGRTGTFVFILEVQPSALPSDTDMSDSEYQLIEQAIEDAQQAVEDSQDAAEDAEAWAVGERGGVPVGPTDPTYHNNSYYWSQQAQSVEDLDDLNDVTITTPLNNQVLTYDSNSGDWVNANPQSVPSDLDDLNDVTISSATNGQVLTYDSNDSEWKNASLPTPDIDDLGDVNISSLSNGQILKYDSVAQEWKNANESGGGASALDDLTDVSISSPTDGQVLKYDSNSSEWINASGGAVSDLDDLSDVAISSPTNGQVLKYNSVSQEWENANESGGSGDFVGLYGTTEIVSGTDLNTLTNVGTYYKTATNFTPTHAPQSVANSKVFILDVRKLSGSSTGLIQEAIYIGPVKYLRTSSDGGSTWSTWRMTPNYLADLTNVQSGGVDGSVLTYNFDTGNWYPNNPHIVTKFSVAITGWTSDTTSQSGTTLYKKQVSLNHVYVESPTVDIGSSGVLPTVAEQESYNLLQYCTVDDSVPCLYLYASAIPTTAFYIKVKGVD